MKLGLKCQFPSFFSKSGGEGPGDDADVASQGEEAIVDLGPTNESEMGIDMIENGNMMGVVADLEESVNKLETSNQSTKSELTAIRRDILDINDTIKNLLAIYEVVSKDYNPFIDTGAPVSSGGENFVSEPFEGTFEDPLDTVIRPEDLHEHEEFMEADYYEEGSIDGYGPGPAREPAPIAPATGSAGVNDPPYVDPSDVVQEGVVIPDPPSKNDYSLMQVQRMLEYELDRVFVKRLQGEPADDDDIAQIIRWFNMFKDLVR